MKKFLMLTVVTLVSLFLVSPVGAVESATPKDQDQAQVQSGEAASVSPEQLELVKKREALKQRRDELLKQRQQKIKSPGSAMGGPDGSQ